MDTNDSMQQMSSFSMVEQITNMASTNTKIAASLNTSSAVGLIGRTVTYLDSDEAAADRHRRDASPPPRTASSTITVSGQSPASTPSITEVA